MSTYSWILSTCKYIGLVIASCSTIWTATNVISVEVAGKKQLTPAGRLSIIFTISGLVISITSNILEDRVKSKKAEAQAKKEFKTTNRIILAGQPLISLTLSIECRGDLKYFKVLQEQAYNTYVAEATGQQGEVSSSRGDAIQFAYGELPLFVPAINGDITENTDYFLHLISLDNHQANVLPFGYLADGTAIETAAGDDDTSHQLVNQTEKLSGGLLFDENIWKPVYTGGERAIAKPQFMGSEEGGIVLRWDLDSNSLFGCLDKLNSGIPLTANLPPVIKIALLYDITMLPVRNANNTSGFDYLWTAETNLEDDHVPVKCIYTDSTLNITPNDLYDQSSTYAVSAVYHKLVTDEEYLETPYCKAMLLVYTREIDI